MKKKITKEEKAVIDKLSHYEMCKFYRFAETGHPYFTFNSEISAYFNKKYVKLGGMTSEISKQLGWEHGKISVNQR